VFAGCTTLLHLRLIHNKDVFGGGTKISDFGKGFYCPTYNFEVFCQKDIHLP